MQLDDHWKELQVFGNHNLMNIQAAWLVCKELGISCQNLPGANRFIYGCV